MENNVDDNAVSKNDVDETVAPEPAPKESRFKRFFKRIFSWLYRLARKILSLIGLAVVVAYLLFDNALDKGLVVKECMISDKIADIIAVENVTSTIKTESGLVAKVRNYEVTVGEEYCFKEDFIFKPLADEEGVE